MHTTTEETERIAEQLADARVEDQILNRPETQVNAQQLAKALKLAATATSRDDLARPALTYVQMAWNNCLLTLTGTNGYMLARSTLIIPVVDGWPIEAGSILIAGRIAYSLAEVLSRTEGDVTLTIGPEAVSVRLTLPDGLHMEITHPQQALTYPDVVRVLSASAGQHMSAYAWLERAELVEAVAGFVGHYMCEVKITPGGLHLEAAEPRRQMLTAAWHTESEQAATVHLSPKLFHQALFGFPEERLLLTTGHARTPVRLESLNHRHLVIIMPMINAVSRGETPQ